MQLRRDRKQVEQPLGIVESGITIYLVYEALVLISRPRLFEFEHEVGTQLLNSWHVDELTLGFVFAALAVLLGGSTIWQMQTRSKASQFTRTISLLLSALLSIGLSITFMFDYPNMLNGALLGLAVIIILTFINSLIAIKEIKKERKR